MALIALEEARKQPGLLIEIRGTISANIAADLLKAHNKAFRAWCRANGEQPRDLVIVDSGTGSYWARLKDAVEVAGLLQLGSDVLPGFMTNLASIVHLGFASDPSEFHSLFTDLLKAYRRAITHKAVEAVVISGLAIESITITSVKQIDQIIAKATLQRIPKVPAPSVGQQVAHAELDWKFPTGLRGHGFKRHGTVRLFDGTVYVRLEGMQGTMLPAHGRQVHELGDGLSYAFEGHTLTNDAKETIGYVIELAEPASLWG
ncbi:hypothetical protein HHL08_15130 [Sphingobium sp. AR-3-1]|uniref:Uncharacterized protein n=1 Tax=Sphingobium psychrophilum TaxID=2728834 RepID=A0A7X9WX13_9SPHN|nr:MULTISPECIES: hypothetical protein [Sphingobium]NML11464.1 hypothetical protein [Sphingobium psychrophilum]